MYNAKCNIVTQIKKPVLIKVATDVDKNRIKNVSQHRIFSAKYFFDANAAHISS